MFTTDIPCNYPGDHSATVLQFMSVGNDTRYLSSTMKHKYICYNYLWVE